MLRWLLVGSLLVLVAGCGGEDGPEPFSTQRVAAVFAELTGDRLVIDAAGGRTDTDVLKLEQSLSGATTAEARYGTFSIYVTHGSGIDGLYKQALDGKELSPDRRGIYWRRLGTDPPAWQAGKRFRNVVLQWQAGHRKATDRRWDRLEAVLSATSAPERARLAVEDRPCRVVGIDPIRGKTGTCKHGQQTLVVVDRGQRLTLPGYSVTRVRASITRRVTSSRLRGFARARGRYVVLRFIVSNRGDAPLERVSPTLFIGRRRYAIDTRALFLLQERSPFPIQPGDRATVVAIYDVPANAARRARSRGALVVDGDLGVAAATIDGATTIGRVRLHRRRPG